MAAVIPCDAFKSATCPSNCWLSEVTLTGEETTLPSEDMWGLGRSLPGCAFCQQAKSLNWVRAPRHQHQR